MSPSKEFQDRSDRDQPPLEPCAEIRVIKEPVDVFRPKTAPTKEWRTGCGPDRSTVSSGQEISDAFPPHNLTPVGDPAPPSDPVLNAELERYKAQVQALALELAKVEERELQRIASDLHDRIGQMLFAAKSKLERLAMKETAPAVMVPVKETLALVNQALLDTRELIVEISPPELYVFGLEAAVTSLLEQIETDYGIRGAFQQMGRPLPLSETLNGVLYRAARELIFNVVKHARAEHIRVEIHYREDGVVITIEDDGRGFESAGRPSEITPKDGYGLFSMKERLGFIGGRLEINTNQDQGTRAVIVLPVRPVPSLAATE